jgi:hypothetical protein
LKASNWSAGCMAWRISFSAADSADPDQPFRPIAITDSGDPDHAAHYA